MSFLGSSAGHSSCSPELSIGKTYSRLLQLLWTVVHWWTAWPIYTGWVTTTWRRVWPRPWHDKCMIEKHSATAVVNDSRGWVPSLPLDGENVSLQLTQVYGHWQLRSQQPSTTSAEYGVASQHRLLLFDASVRSLKMATSHIKPWFHVKIKLF